MTTQTVLLDALRILPGKNPRTIFERDEPTPATATFSPIVLRAGREEVDYKTVDPNGTVIDTGIVYREHGDDEARGRNELIWESNRVIMNGTLHINTTGKWTWSNADFTRKGTMKPDF